MRKLHRPLSIFQEKGILPKERMSKSAFPVIPESFFWKKSFFKSPFINIDWSHHRSDFLFSSPSSSHFIVKFVSPGIPNVHLYHIFVYYEYWSTLSYLALHFSSMSSTEFLCRPLSYHTDRLCFGYCTIDDWMAWLKSIVFRSVIMSHWKGWANNASTTRYRYASSIFIFCCQSCVLIQRTFWVSK